MICLCLSFTFFNLLFLIFNLFITGYVVCAFPTYARISRFRSWILLFVILYKFISFICCRKTQKIPWYNTATWLYPAICHGVPISRQSARKQIRNLASSRGTWKVHLASWSAWLMLHLSGQVWNMPALYRILISSRTVMHWSESRGGLLAGSHVSTIGVQALPLCYTKVTT